MGPTSSRSRAEIYSKAKITVAKGMGGLQVGLEGLSLPLEANRTPQDVNTRLSENIRSTVEWAGETGDPPSESTAWVTINITPSPFSRLL